eukprot:Amastigsp_a670_359.p1 type:complete len:192 gc:universal Amastigsp_a670_359:1482-907(-)
MLKQCCQCCLSPRSWHCETSATPCGSPLREPNDQQLPGRPRNRGSFEDRQSYPWWRVKPCLWRGTLSVLDDRQRTISGVSVPEGPRTQYPWPKIVLPRALTPASCSQWRVSRRSLILAPGADKHAHERRRGSSRGPVITMGGLLQSVAIGCLDVSLEACCRPVGVGCDVAACLHDEGVQTRSRRTALLVGA